MLKISFVGDVSFTGGFRHKCLESSQVLDDRILKIFFESDSVICNLEGPSSDSLENYLRPEVRVASPSNTIKMLNDSNVKVFNLANNHMFDCGVEGFSETAAAIKKHNCEYFGAGNNLDEASSILFINKKNIRVALIGIAHEEGPYASESDYGIFCVEKTGLQLLRNKINEAKQTSDWVVVNYHGGEEFTNYPLPRRRKFLNKIAKLRPDIIICHHPHVLQGVEDVRGCKIFYSLGNFIFDLECHKGMEYVDEGVVLSINFNKTDYHYNLYPTTVDRNMSFVKYGINSTLERINNNSLFTNYYTKWLRDCYRVIFMAKGNGLNKNTVKATSNLSIYRYFNIIKKTFSLLSKKNKRCVVISAHVYNLYSKSIKIIHKYLNI